MAGFGLLKKPFYTILEYDVLFMIFTHKNFLRLCKVRKQNITRQQHFLIPNQMGSLPAVVLSPALIVLSYNATQHLTYSRSVYYKANGWISANRTVTDNSPATQIKNILLPTVHIWTKWRMFPVWQTSVFYNTPSHGTGFIWERCNRGPGSYNIIRNSQNTYSWDGA